MRIIKTTPRKRKPNFLDIEIENRGVETIHVQVVEKYRLYPGEEISLRQLELALAEDEAVRCRETAWRLLSLKPRAAAELRRALRQRKYPAALVDRMVEDMQARGYLDDATFARLFAEERQRRGDGPRRIQSDLRSRGVSAEETEQAISSIQDSETEEENARKLLTKWNRRTKPEDPRKRRTAAAAFLIRKGHEPDLVWQLIREILGEDA